mgnify:CR=1 FL=1
MNNVDKDIEQFEQNLLAINEMKNQIFELKNSLNNKEDINKEINIVDKFCENINIKINEVINNIHKENTIIKIALVISIILNIIILIIK